MLKLLVPNTDTADAVLPVSWCVGANELAIIQREKILKPHLLLLIAKMERPYYYSDGEKDVWTYNEVERKLIPLKQGMDYVEFQEPGTYGLFACIVGNQEGNIKEMRKLLDRRETGAMVEYNGKFYPPKPYLRKTKQLVEVAADFLRQNHQPESKHG